jgi:glucuronoarabinoxylan endo-1,4-beta-xylanase
MKKISVVLFMLCLPLTVAAQSTIHVTTLHKHQTLTGFGASIGYYENWLTAHPNKKAIYNLIFGALKLDILRLRNIYGYDNNTIDHPKEIVQQAQKSLGHPIEVMLTAWSPPAEWKKDGITNGGTLLKINRQFAYGRVARWWVDAIRAYSAAGIVPTYISLQNEPDYENSSWDTCIYQERQTADYPGYGAALKVLHGMLKGLPHRPLIIGPEVTGVGGHRFQNYVQNLNPHWLDAYAYHLYNGGDPDHPDSFNANLAGIKNAFGNKPNFMTEYSGGNWFSTAWLIQNCLINANASAYLYWDLIWGDSGGLVALEFPWAPSSWSTPNGYKINADYYAVKHFSKFLSKGYARIGAWSSNSDLRTTAFLSPDGRKLTVVILNVAQDADSAVFAFTGFGPSSVKGYLSVDHNYFQSLNILSPADSIALPARSVTTLEFSKGSGKRPAAGIQPNTSPKNS